MGIIRFLLALSVLIVHSDPIMGIEILPGYLAVQLFYVISGFYMTLIFTEKYAVTNRPLYYFYSNRLLRLYPLYALVVALVTLLSIVYGLSLGSFGKLQYYADQYSQSPDSLSSLMIILFFNISLIGQDWITFFNFADNGVLEFIGLQSDIKLQEFLFIPIAWTIAVELFFYGLTPFVANKGLQKVIMVIVLVLALRLLLHLFWGVSNGFSIYRFAPTEFFWFLLGVLSYKLYQRQWLPGRRYGLWLMAVVVLGLLTYRFLLADWVLFVVFVLSIPAIFYKVSASRIDRYIGELTYPLYISHTLFLMIVSANRFPKVFGTGLPVLVMTLIFSILCYHYFLKPLENVRASRILSDGKYK
ncbi:MAG: acyltransferase family protein [Bacteroidota bacterium]